MFAEWKRYGAEGIMNELEYPRIYCYTSRHVCLHITLRVMTKIGNGFQSAVCLQSVQGDIYQVSNVVPRVNTPSHITFPPDLMRICPNQISVIFNWTCVLTSGTTKYFIVYGGSSFSLTTFTDHFVQLDNLDSWSLRWWRSFR